MGAQNLKYFCSIFITSSFSISSLCTISSGVYRCGFLFHCMKLSTNASDPLASLPPIFFFCKLFSSSTYSPNYHAAKRDSEPALGDLAGLENERQIYKSVLEGGDIPFQGLSGLKRPSSSASTKGRLSGHGPDLHSVQCVKSVVIWGKVLQGLQSCSSQLRVPLSFLFAISSFLSFLPQPTQTSIFHDAFT